MEDTNTSAPAEVAAPASTEAKAQPAPARKKRAKADSKKKSKKKAKKKVTAADLKRTIKEQKAEIVALKALLAERGAGDFANGVESGFRNAKKPGFFAGLFDRFRKK